MTETPQQRIKATLQRAGIPAKQIDVYGSQIMITAWSQDAARKWFRLLQQFCSTTRQPLESTDDNKAQKGTRLVEFHKVWRVWGTI